MSLLSIFEADAQKTEAWVVAEIAKGWTALQTAEQTVVVDIEAIFGWVKAHQASLLTTFQDALTGIALVGTLDPGAAPVVAGATTAIDAATAAIDVLSSSVVAGSTPLSTITNAYAATKNAANAVSTALQAATKQGAVKAPATPAAPASK